MHLIETNLFCQSNCSPFVKELINREARDIQRDESTKNVSSQKEYFNKFDEILSQTKLAGNLL